MTNEQIRIIADALLSDNPSYEEVEQVADRIIAASKKKLEKQYVIYYCCKSKDISTGVVYYSGQ